MNDSATKQALSALWDALSRNDATDSLGLSNPIVRSVHRSFLGGAREVHAVQANVGRCRRATLLEQLLYETHEPFESDHCGPGCGCDLV